MLTFSQRQALKCLFYAWNRFRGTNNDVENFIRYLDARGFLKERKIIKLLKREQMNYGSPIKGMKV